MLMLAEDGKLTPKDCPMLPVTVKESALAPVTGQSILVEVVVPSGRTVMVCWVREERQILPKFNVASASCVKDKYGIMYILTATGTSVHDPKDPTLNCTGPVTVPEIVQGCVPSKDTSVNVAPTGKETDELEAVPEALVPPLVVVKLLIETVPHPEVEISVAVVVRLVSKLTVEENNRSIKLKSPIVAVPALPETLPVSGPVPLEDALPLAAIVITSNPLLPTT